MVRNSSLSIRDPPASSSSEFGHFPTRRFAAGAGSSSAEQIVHIAQDHRGSQIHRVSAKPKQPLPSASRAFTAASKSPTRSRSPPDAGS
jgi:hypothetical protein